MNKADTLLIIATQALRVAQNETDLSIHTKEMDKVTHFVNENFSPEDIDEAGFAVSVMAMCLRGSCRGLFNGGEGGLKPLYPSHTNMQHFSKFHKLFGDLILSHGDENAICARIDQILGNQYHTTITAYSMSECVVKEIQKVAWR